MSGGVEGGGGMEGGTGREWGEVALERGSYPLWQQVTDLRLTSVTAADDRPVSPSTVSPGRARSGCSAAEQRGLAPSPNHKCPLIRLYESTFMQVMYRQLVTLTIREYRKST